MSRRKKTEVQKAIEDESFRGFCRTLMTLQMLLNHDNGFHEYLTKERGLQSTTAWQYKTGANALLEYYAWCLMPHFSYLENGAHALEVSE